MDGFELTYYKLLTGEWSTTGPYGEDSLYSTAVIYFIKQIPIYREIIDVMGDECEIDLIDDYLMMLHALFIYYEKSTLHLVDLTLSTQ